MKILQLISGKGLGGSRTVFSAYNALFEHLGHTSISLLRPGAKIAAHLNPATTHYVRYYRVPFVPFLSVLPLKRAIERIGPELIFVHKPVDALLVRLAFPDATIYLVVHGFWTCKYLNSASVLIAVSPAVQAHLAELGYESKLVSNFLPHIDPPPQINWHTPVRFGALGYFRRTKGFADLIEACSLLEKAHAQFEMEICGRGVLGPFLRYLINFRYRLGNVALRSWQKDVQSWMKGIDVLVVPSKSETFGMVILEAMANGVLVISTRSGGPQHIIQSGETGVLVPIADPRAISEAMLEVINDPQKWTTVRMNGYEMVVDRYGLERAAGEMRGVLRKLRKWRRY